MDDHPLPRIPPVTNRALEYHVSICFVLRQSAGNRYRMNSRETLSTAVAIIGLLSSCVVAAVRASGVHSSVECLDDYMEARSDIINQYQSSHLNCYKRDSTHQRSAAAVDVEGEKTNLAKISDEICFTLQVCNQIEDPKSYLECYSETASQNFIKSMEIHLNASSIVIELNEDYEESEREFLRCNLQANREFMTDSFNAFQLFLDCVDAE